MNRYLKKILPKAVRRFYYVKFKFFWYGTFLRMPWILVRYYIWYTREHSCEYCEFPLHWDIYTVDHYIPKSKGGSNKPKNLRICCRRCNRIKADQMPSNTLFEALKEYEQKRRQKRR